MKDLDSLILSCIDKFKNLSDMVPSSYFQKLSILDDRMAVPEFWNNIEEATKISKERQSIYSVVSKLVSIKESLNFFKECAKDIPEEIDIAEVESLSQEIDDFSLVLMMKDPMSNKPAIMTINSGAGGLEAANWVTMLMHMYVKWAVGEGFECEILDLNPCNEHSAICTDSVSLRFSGKNAYGYLKGETGVHRLIRNSPFNSGSARHTSFAAISVVPDIEDSIDVDLNMNDVEIKSQTSSGKGGQNVNRVQSAIRLKHIPTGIIVLSRSERDQSVNKKNAFKILKSKLYDLEVKKKKKEKDKAFQEQADISFGSQIRTFTMSPYSLIKDHRSKYSTSDVQSILDGDLNKLILSVLSLSE